MAHPPNGDGLILSLLSTAHYCVQIGTGSEGGYQLVSWVATGDARVHHPQLEILLTREITVQPATEFNKRIVADPFSVPMRC